MKNIGHVVALGALAGSIPLQAAPDSGLQLHDTGIGKRETGVGVTVGIRIKLDSDRVVKRSDRVTLGLSAGPVMVLPDSAANIGVRRERASIVGINFRPGYSTSLNFAGKPILADYTRLGAAENDDEKNDTQSTVDKVAWVAAVAGVVAVGTVFIAFATQGPYD